MKLNVALLKNPREIQQIGLLQPFIIHCTHPPTFRREGGRSDAVMYFQSLFSKHSFIYPFLLVSEALDSLNWITTLTFHSLSG